MGKEKRPFCCHQNFIPKWLSVPALGLYTCIKALKYIPGPGVRRAFTGPQVLWFRVSRVRGNKKYFIFGLAFWSDVIFGLAKKVLISPVSRYLPIYLYPWLLCRGVYSFRLSVRLFVRTSIPFVELLQSFTCKQLSGVYLANHSSESIHIWTIGTLEGRLSFHDSSPQGPCPGMGLEVKI